MAHPDAVLVSGRLFLLAAVRFADPLTIALLWDRVILGRVFFGFGAVDSRGLLQWILQLAPISGGHLFFDSVVRGPLVFG